MCEDALDLLQNEVFRVLFHVVLYLVHGVVLQPVALDLVCEYVEADKFVEVVIDLDDRLGLCVKPLDICGKYRRPDMFQLDCGGGAFDEWTIESFLEKEGGGADDAFMQRELFLFGSN